MFCMDGNVVYIQTAADELNSIVEVGYK